MPLSAVAGVAVVFVAVHGGGGARIVRFICVPARNANGAIILYALPLSRVFDNETPPRRRTALTILTNRTLIVKQ